MASWKARYREGKRRRPVLSQAKASSPELLRVMFASGGTGGHVYPAIAIADAIKALDPTAEIVFAGTRDRMEWTAVPNAGYQISEVKARSLHRPILSPANLLLPAHLLLSLWSSWQAIHQFRPHVVVGTGGYVSWSTCMAAWAATCQLVVLEQNARPGLANRVLGVFADVIIVAFRKAISHFPAKRCILVGNPIRGSLLDDPSPRPLALRHFFPTLDSLPAGKVIVAVGGSLGARAINAAMEEASQKLLAGGMLVIWQTGERYFEEVRRRVGEHPHLRLLPYVERMDLVYKCADIFIGRSGAVTCSELLVTSTPSVLIPSANVTDDHQSVNAKSMVEIGASVQLPEGQLTGQTLCQTVEGLLKDNETLLRMKECAERASAPESAVQIARLILGLVSKKKPKVMNQILRRVIVTLSLCFSIVALLLILLI